MRMLGRRLRRLQPSVSGACCSRQYHGAYNNEAGMACTRLLQMPRH
jgi:hypothetical protein